VLTWTPSRSSTGPNDKSMGYCVYRSDHKIVADTLEDCHDCKTITPAPISGAGCVDDFGDDSNTYYYAALALNSSGQKSKFSNKTEAKFSRKKAKHQSLNNQTYPACRPSLNLNARSPATLPAQ